MTTSEIDRDIYRKVRDGELEEKATCREFRQVRTEDKAVRKGQGVDMTDEQARAYEYLERYYQAFIKAVGESNTTEM